MQRVRFLLSMTVLTVGLFVATTPVFAAAGGIPGKPVLPEAPFPVLLPLAGFVVIGLIFCVILWRTRKSEME